MNSDSESLPRQLIAWLLAYNVRTDNSNSVVCKDIDGVENFDETTATSRSGDFQSGCMPQTFQLGEIPTVQERFQAVLKRRLQIQIENNPPLFPWETHLIEYPECVDNSLLELVPVGWTAQQYKLNLPIRLPDRIFQQLLDKCQALIASSLPLGAKLVQAVESFFPDNDSQTLNDLAGLVLRSPNRSVDTLEKMPNLGSSYSDLQQSQQMALSLLAAKQLLETTTVPISTTNPVVERQWLTSAGILTLRIEYQFEGMTKLRVQSELPTKGTVKLQGNASQAIAESSSPGCLSVELCYTQLNQTYTLFVELQEIDQQPLLFVIVPTM